MRRGGRAQDVGESQSAPAPPPTATVKPRGSPLAAYILSSLEAAGYASDEAMDPADVNVAVFLLCEPGGIEASAAYVTKLRSGLPAVGKVAVAVTSPLTWACTPGEGSGPEGAFTPADYTRRVAAPTARSLLAAEISLMRASRPNGATVYVICPGLVYGAGEQEFAPLWRMAWEGTPVPIFGDGENGLVVVHAEDLAQAVVAVASTRPSESYFIVAEERRVTQAQLATTVASAFERPPPVVMSEEKALLTCEDWALPLRLNIALHGGSPETPLPALMHSFESDAVGASAQYVEFHGLTPLRVFFQGPELAGRSAIAAAFAREYGLPLITAAVAESALAQEPPPDGQPTGPDSEQQRRLEGVAAMLTSSDCALRGFVLDGYPLSPLLCSRLFDSQLQVRAPTDGEEGGPPLVLPPLVPHLNAVVLVDAPASALEEAVAALEEEDQRTAALAALAAYRAVAQAPPRAAAAKAAEEKAEKTAAALALAQKEVDESSKIKKPGGAQSLEALQAALVRANTMAAIAREEAALASIAAAEEAAEIAAAERPASQQTSRQGASPSRPGSQERPPSGRPASQSARPGSKKDKREASSVPDAPAPLDFFERFAQRSGITVLRSNGLQAAEEIIKLKLAVGSAHNFSGFPGSSSHGALPVRQGAGEASSFRPRPRLPSSKTLAAGVEMDAIHALSLLQAKAAAAAHRREQVGASATLLKTLRGAVGKTIALGMLELCEQRPDDPLEFLADWFASAQASQALAASTAEEATGQADEPGEELQRLGTASSEDRQQFVRQLVSTVLETVLTPQKAEAEEARDPYYDDE